MAVTVGSGADRSSGNYALIETLRRWGIMFYSGVNGGGVIHVAKHLEPFTDLSQAAGGVSRFLTMSEYASGFVPVGYYLASGRVAGSITTTGAATKLGSSGITDAKLHNIPAVYLIALNSTLSIGMAPIQDVSECGMNIVPQLQAELGEGCIVLDNIHKLEGQLRRAQEVLNESRPVALAIYPDVLSNSVHVDAPKVEPARGVNRDDLAAFLEKFPRMAVNRRVVIYVGEEAARSHGIQPLTTQLSELLQAPTVWSVNGANAVSPENRYGFGYILFGGNDRATELWNSVNPNDILIALGFDPGEYSINLQKIPAGFVWHFTNLKEPYGHKHGEFRHRVAGGYQQVRGDIALVLSELIPRLGAVGLGERPRVELQENLNTREISREVRPGCVDFVAFYEQIQQCWRPNSIGFDDVCISYKDRQYVTQRPHPCIRFYTTHHGSAMGASFGLGVGAKIADPSLHTFVFSGDGCWRLFGGALADAANLDLRLFIINNGTYAIVDKGLEVIIPDVDKRLYHAKLPRIDFVAAAKAHGWDGFSLNPDLSNLKEIMEACYTQTGRSILVDVPVDPDQVIGLNPRLLNLTLKTYL
ncbi:MAG: thiamine pyrophosphate-binding protein [Candidatus Rokubacteria bacterium]|nr:thiamine pyrophosphate-binding protein [Candidatus Rokubacteria bacterium]